LLNQSIAYRFFVHFYFTGQWECLFSRNAPFILFPSLDGRG
jgi:hypothetical protein